MRCSVFLCLAALFYICAAAPAVKQERCDCEFCECIHGHECVDGLCVPRSIVGFCTLGPTPSSSPSCVPQHSHTTIVSIKDGSKDDGEERVSDGYVVTDSFDLDMVRDKIGGSFNQLVGLRFVNLGVPTRSTIQQAYITFTADETDSEPTWLEISAEATDNARQIRQNPFDISNRPRTRARVNWTNVPTWDLHRTYDTPDISSILQELVDRPKFFWGNSVMFILQGNGKRVAESFEGVSGITQTSQRGSPKLTVVWAPSTYSLSRSISESSGDTQQLLSSGNLMEFTEGIPGIDPAGRMLVEHQISTTSRVHLRSADVFRTLVLTEGGKSDPGDSTRRTTLRFSHLILPKMAKIKRAFLTFKSARDDGHDTVLKIHDVVDNVTSGTSWDVPLWFAGQTYDSPDISSMLQKMVDSSIWVAGNDVTLFISGHGKRVAYSFDENPKHAPALTVHYKSSTPAFTIPIRGGNNDGYGNNNLDEDKVEFKNANNPAAFRFRGVYIPQGAFITNAFIKFTGAPDTSSSANFAINIFAERRGFSSRFANHPSADRIGNKERTHAFVTWEGNAAWSTGDVVKSPDLRSVIQEVVDLNAWKKGNSLTLIVDTQSLSGGRLKVVSFEGNEHKAAELVIFYNPIAKTIKQSVLQSNVYELGDSPPPHTIVVEMPAIGLPKGVTILEATLRVATAGDAAAVTNPGVTIQVQRFAAGDTQLTSLNGVGTLGSESFDLPSSYVDGQFLESANLKDVLQGSVNQADWDDASGFRFIITVQEFVPLRGFADPKTRPMLKIVYEDPSSDVETCW